MRVRTGLNWLNTGYNSRLFWTRHWTFHEMRGISSYLSDYYPLKKGPWPVAYRSTNATLLTYSTEQSPSWEANRLSASQEVPRILWNRKVSSWMFSPDDLHTGPVQPIVFWSDSAYQTHVKPMRIPRTMGAPCSFKWPCLREYVLCVLL